MEHDLGWGDVGKLGYRQSHRHDHSDNYRKNCDDNRYNWPPDEETGHVLIPFLRWLMRLNVGLECLGLHGHSRFEVLLAFDDDPFAGF